MKNVIYFITGLVILMGFTGLNMVNLTVHTLINGRKPVFDLQRKIAEGGILVHDGMAGTTEVV